MASLNLIVILSNLFSNSLIYLINGDSVYFYSYKYYSCSN